MQIDQRIDALESYYIWFRGGGGEADPENSERGGYFKYFSFFYDGNL